MNQPQSPMQDRPTAIKPPFPWHGALAASGRHASMLASATMRLAEVSVQTDGEPACWDVPNMPWLTKISGEMRAVAAPVFDIEMGDLSLDQPSIAFADWLLAACFSGATDSEHHASELTAHWGIFRRQEVCSLDAKGKPVMKYYPTEVICTELIEIIRVCRNNTEVPPLVLAVGVFSHFLAVHPLRDGNGRVARRLLLGTLRKFQLWNHSPLPVAFMIHHDRERHVMALESLQRDRTWDIYIEYMASMICAAAEMSALTRYRIYESGA